MEIITAVATAVRNILFTIAAHPAIQGVLAVGIICLLARHFKR